MFAAIIRRLLAYRHQKHVQYEMTAESLEGKREMLEEYERSEAEAQRLASALSAATAPRRSSANASPSLTPNKNPNLALPDPNAAAPGQGQAQGQGLSPSLSPVPSADSLTQSPTQVSIPDADELDGSTAWGGTNASPSHEGGAVWGQGARSQAWASRISSGLSSTLGAGTEASASTTTVGPSGSTSTGGVHKRAGSGAKGILNALSYSFQGIMDVDPEAARRNGISKTRDGISQVGSLFWYWLETLIDWGFGSWRIRCWRRLKTSNMPRPLFKLTWTGSNARK